ncbi:unnamed protein product [Linum tenue]|uniref:Uncharacterized protein n=1 Tax=Linum tenue TaxID=586396 RepID=A0AAV0H7S5_9ROSI|nr:unnamed protein product [Linum tenue]
MRFAIVVTVFILIRCYLNFVCTFVVYCVVVQLLYMYGVPVLLFYYVRRVMNNMLREFMRLERWDWWENRRNERRRRARELARFGQIFLDLIHNYSQIELQEYLYNSALLGLGWEHQLGLVYMVHPPNPVLPHVL